MTESNTRSNRAITPKKLHLIMRDNTLIEGAIHIGDDQSLLKFLGSRKGGWMNVVQAWRPKFTERQGHLVVQVDHVVMAVAPEGDVPVVGATGAGSGERAVEIVLVGGTAVRGMLPVAPMQRMSDQLNQFGKFVGLMRARMAGDERELGDVAIHSAAITLVRETTTGAPALPAEA